MRPDDWIAQNGWGGAASEPLRGDASSRRYWRLRRGADRAILMSDPQGDVGRFARLAEYLLHAGLSAPRIFARDDALGLLLIEDFGDAVFAPLSEADPEVEKRLYATASQALLQLHRVPPAGDLDLADPARLVAMTDLFFDHYLPFSGHAPEPGLRGRIEAELGAALAQHAMPADVTILRDFHAENLMWLPDREGACRAGLLDFQDAMTGHRAYDLASLLRDARRDVRLGAEAAAIDTYLAGSGLEKEAFLASLAVLSVQRNLRILGIFVRLARVMGKPRYLALVPRVLGHVARDLGHPALAGLRPLLEPLLAPRQPIAAMVFAAGFGTRMGALTATRPKPLIEVAGKALIDHALEQVGAEGPLNTVVNAHYLADQIVAHMEGKPASVSVETDVILDTGGGLRNALPVLGPGPVLTLNADMVWSGPAALSTLRAAWDPDRMGALLLLVPADRAVGRDGPGDFALDAEGRLTRGGPFVYSGAQILHTGPVAAIGDRVFSLNRVWNALAAEGRLFGCVHPGLWCDVGHPEGIALAERALAEFGHV